MCLRTVSLQAACLFDTDPLAPLAQASPMWSGGTCDCGPFGALTTVQPRNDFRLQIRRSREVERGEVMMAFHCSKFEVFREQYCHIKIIKVVSHTCSFVSFLFLNVSQVFADMVFIVWLMMFDVFDLTGWR